jgi:transposase InsO family protein
VFEDPEAAYDAARQEFVRRSAPRTPRRGPARAARRERQETAAQWRHLLQHRQQEDAAWEAACQERRRWLRPAQWTPTFWAAYRVAEDQWLQQRAPRPATLAQRQQEDAQWLADQAPLAAPTAKPPWIAILVVTANCTRPCLALPLFAVGPKVTAEEVVAALRAPLPAALEFLLLDRGTHFTAHPFAQCAQEEDFVHGVPARHRPESKGIAERFVRTRKEWLGERAWSETETLARLLEQFRTEYHARPHQGLPLPGRSPNEFAARFWLL